MRACVRCENFFEPRRRDQKYCSPECAKARNPQNRCSVCGQVTPKGKYKYCSYACQLEKLRLAYGAEHLEVTCSCGKTFTRKASHQRYCSPVCRRKYDHADRRKRGTHRENPGYFDCKKCHGRTPLENPLSQRSVCDACKVEAKQAKKEARLVGQCSPVPWRECPICQERFVSRAKKYCGRSCAAKAGNLLPQTAVFECRQCGVSVTREPGNGWRRAFCSLKCGHEHHKRKHRGSPAYKKMKLEANRRRRARKRSNAPVEKIDFDLVLQRDEYSCQLCHEQVDWSVAAKYPTLDHIVPISKGGSHTYKNVQVAHQLCNSRKRDVLVLNDRYVRVDERWASNLDEAIAWALSQVPDGYRFLTGSCGGWGANPEEIGPYYIHVKAPAVEHVA